MCSSADLQAFELWQRSLKSLRSTGHLSCLCVLDVAPSERQLQGLGGVGHMVEDVMAVVWKQGESRVGWNLTGRHVSDALVLARAESNPTREGETVFLPSLK
jgi:hypothetical protein